MNKKTRFTEKKAREFLEMVLGYLSCQSGDWQEKAYIAAAALASRDAGLSVPLGIYDNGGDMQQLFEELRSGNDRVWARILRMAHDIDRPLYGMLKALSPLSDMHLIFIRVDDDRASAHGEIEAVAQTLWENLGGFPITKTKYCVVLPNAEPGESDLMFRLEISQEPEGDNEKGGDNE